MASILKLVFSENRVCTYVQVVSRQKTGFWLINLSGLPIRGLFFGGETIWNHVLTWISEKTDFKRQHTTLIHTIACLDLYRAQTTTTYTHLDHTRHLLMLHYLLSDDCADWNQFCKKNLRCLRTWGGVKDWKKCVSWCDDVDDILCTNMKYGQK